MGARVSTYGRDTVQPMTGCDDYDHSPWQLGKIIKSRRRRGRQDEMVGWHHQHNGHEFEKTLGAGDGQGSLMCCTPWGHKESDMTERLNWIKSQVDGLDTWYILIFIVHLPAFWQSMMSNPRWQCTFFHGSPWTQGTQSTLLKVRVTSSILLICLLACIPPWGPGPLSLLHPELWGQEACIPQVSHWKWWWVGTFEHLEPR